MTRTKAVPDFAPSCKLHLTLDATNHFKGGQIPGIASPPIASKTIAGPLFEREIVPVPTLGLGQSTELTVAFTRFKLFTIPELAGYLGNQTKQPPCSDPRSLPLSFP